jgi:hypothetical protein
MTRIQQLLTTTVAAGAMLVGLVAPAMADYAIGGNWYANRGQTFNIPNKGGVDTSGTPVCTNVVLATGGNPPNIPSTAWVNAPCVRHQRQPSVFPSVARAAIGNKGGGGINDGQKLTGTMPGVGATFTVPGGLMNSQFSSQAAVPGNPVVQQVDTSFHLTMPFPIRDSAMNGLQTQTVAPVPAFTRVMQPSAWVGSKGQTNRAAANFTVTKMMGTAVSRQVRYKAGGNAFGGTMAMLITQGGAVWIKADVVTAFPGTEVMRSPLGGGAGSDVQAPGKGYSLTNSRMGDRARVFANYNIPTACAPGVLPPSPVGCDLLTGVSFFLVSLPATTTNTANPYYPYSFMLPNTLNTGFPFTTGHVSVYAKGTQGGVPLTTTLSAVGNDTSVGGVRTVQLVAGQMSLRNNVLQGGLGRTAGLDAVTITLPEPSSTLMFAGAMGLIGTLFGVRRRLF